MLICIPEIFESCLIVIKNESTRLLAPLSNHPPITRYPYR